MNSIVSYLQSVFFDDHSVPKVKHELSNGEIDDTPPPKAKKSKFVHEVHGDQRPDEYHWFEDAKLTPPSPYSFHILQPCFFTYLQEWNIFTCKYLEKMAQLRERLYQEMTTLFPQTFDTYPFKIGSFLYFARYDRLKEYPLYCRKQGVDGKEEILIDSTEVGKILNLTKYEISNYHVSPNQNLIAYIVYDQQKDVKNIFIKDLQKNEFLSEDCMPMAGCKKFLWNTQSSGFWYVNKKRTVRFHALGTPSSEDITYRKSEKYDSVQLKTDPQGQKIFITFRNEHSSEVWVGDIDKPTSVNSIHKREKGFFYKIYPGFENCFIDTERKGGSSLIFITPSNDLAKSQWRLFQKLQDGEIVIDIVAFKDYIAIQKKFRRLNQIEIINIKTGEIHFMPLPQQVCDIEFPEDNDLFGHHLIFKISSLIQPANHYVYDMKARKLQLSRQSSLSGYDPSQYTVEILWAVALDGTKVPITIAHQKGLVRDGSSPLILRAYGAYGYAYIDSFYKENASLLKRGVSVAIAHVRGGGEMGHGWHEGGKKDYKKNSITDFIACAEYLITQGYTSPAVLAIDGCSAGGTIMAASLNMRPDLFKACIAEVPFVDILPIEKNGEQEWGNPTEDEKMYDYIRSYSPYENIRSQDYPSLFVTAGLHDKRVRVSEVAKWVAKLLEYKTDNNPLLFQINMEGGHKAEAGRFALQAQKSSVYAFILHEFGIKE